MALGFGGFTRSLSRKRIVVSTNVEDSSLDDSSSVTPLKRMRSGTFNLNSDRSRLEALPQDILIRVLCGVDHDDLEHLYQVSKTIKEAALIAKQMHFEYSTPKKSTFALHLAFTNVEDDNLNGVPEIEPPNAPLMKKYTPRLGGKKLADLAVALFA